MKDVLLFLVQSLADHPGDMEVHEAGDGDRTILTITAPKEDMGKIIGRNGRIIRAIRDLMKVLATKRGVYVDVVLAEQEISKSAHGKSTNE